MLATQAWKDLRDPRFFVPWRLSGLLSGYLPTDTRPQARAKLGKSGNRGFELPSQDFFQACDKICLMRACDATHCGFEVAENEQKLRMIKET
jgi:hypothetical protein